MNARLQLAASRLALAGFLAVALGFWQAASPAPARAASSVTITYTSTATYTVDPTRRQVHVGVRTTATVHAHDTAATRSWSEGLQLAVPSSTDGFQASAGSAPLPVTILSRNQSDSRIAVGFGKRLYADQSITFLLEFNIVDRGTAPNRDLRISRTLVSFPVWAFGTEATPGSSVVVAFPSGYTVNQEVGSLTADTNQTGATTYRSGPLGDVAQFYAWFSAHTTPTYDETTAHIGPLEVTLRYWADDPNWAPAIAGLLARGFPVLHDLIGIGDPASKSVTVVESPVPDGTGFSGMYEPDTGTISVSYTADPFVLLHETAHLWFNGDLVSARWEAEGFATYYAMLAAQRLNVAAVGPQLTSDNLSAAIPLDQWGVTENPDPKQEQYAYAAAALAARQIAAIAGPEGLVETWAADRAGFAAYQPEGSTTWTLRSGPAPDSRGLLDLLEEKTGKAFDGVWREWVLGTGGTAILDRRAAARSSYSALLDEAAGWSLPDELRRSLEAWDFDGFTFEVAEARAVFANRATIATAVVREGTSAPPTLRAIFERDGLAAALRESSAELQALDALAAARVAGEGASGTAGAVGLFGANPDRTLQQARDAFAAGKLDETIRLANDARSIWEGAMDAGRNRLLLVGGAVAALVLVLAIALIVRRRGRGRRRASAGGVVATAAAAPPEIGVVEASTPALPPVLPALAGPLASEAIPPSPVIAASANGNGSHETRVDALPEPLAEPPVPARR